MRLAAHGIVAVFTGLLLSTASAQAADLGGDCCADLEERVAELEATTARKGNRRMSLTVSGQVNRTILYWNGGAVPAGANTLAYTRVWTTLAPPRASSFPARRRSAPM